MKTRKQFVYGLLVAICLALPWACHPIPTLETVEEPEEPALPPTYSLSVARIGGQSEDYGTVAITGGGSGTSAAGLASGTSVTITATPSGLPPYRGQSLVR
jgi:hypothetical protein